MEKKRNWLRSGAEPSPSGPPNYHDSSHGEDCGWSKEHYTFIRCLYTHHRYQSEDNRDGRCRALVPWPSQLEGTAAMYCDQHRGEAEHGPNVEPEEFQHIKAMNDRVMRRWSMPADDAPTLEQEREKKSQQLAQARERGLIP